MDNYSYPTSYPDSVESSPRSREIDFETTAPWEEQPAAPKVKFMCSYGGKIHPRPHDNQLAYIGGETKILAVDRSTKFSGLIAKLSALCDADVCFKYQLPGEDLDALISVTNDDDLEHMMHEYDRLSRASSKPARLRLFLFPANQRTAAAEGRLGSVEGKSDRERFVDALNSGPVQSSPEPSAVPPPDNVDFLFGLDKGMLQPPPVAAKVQDPIPEPEIQAPSPEDPDPIKRQIQDFQRLHIGGQEQAMYWRKTDDKFVGGFPGDYYAQQSQEKLPQATLQANVPAAMPAPPGYWQGKHIDGGVYTTTTPEPVYMIPSPTGAYHAPMGRVPVTGPAGQGYYAVQRMPSDVYRDQPSLYNVVQQAPPATTLAPPQQPQKVAGFPEGMGMARPTTVGGADMVNYSHMAYDNGAGRQVYYTGPGGVMVPPPPQPYQAMAAAVSAEMRPAGALNQEGKVVKAPQAAV